MDVQEVIRRYNRGVTFECGCTEQGLHPAIERKLLAGVLHPRTLEECPAHRLPMVPEPGEVPPATAGTLI